MCSATTTHHTILLLNSFSWPIPNFELKYLHLKNTKSGASVTQLLCFPPTKCSQFASGLRVHLRMCLACSVASLTDDDISRSHPHLIEMPAHVFSLSLTLPLSIYLSVSLSLTHTRARARSRAHTH